MIAVITGGEGFIGKALANHLRQRGAYVISIDRKCGIEAGDFFMNNPLDDVDVVFHLAAQTSVFNTNKSDIMHDNLEVFKIVCDVCAARNVKLVYASSSTANEGNTTSLYGISKQFNEQYAACYNPKATGVRFHNVYGPEPRQGTLLWYLLNNEHVSLYNNGQNVRHFTYIDDIVESLIFAAGTSHQLINAANPEAITTLQLAEMVRKYKPIDIRLVATEREFDRKEQKVNESVYTVPLQYTTVADGLRRIFNDEHEQTQ